MNRTLKRVLGLTGSVVLGVAGAVTFASAAQAHHPTITGITECAPDGGWNVTWQVTDWEGTHDAVGTIKSVEGELNEGAEIVEGATLPAYDSGDHLVASQDLPADQATAEIKVYAEWDNGASGETTGKVSAPAEVCGEEEPPAEPEPQVEVFGWIDCLGIHVDAINLNEEALAEFTYVPSVGESVSAKPEAHEYFSHFFALEDPAEGLTVEVLVDGESFDTYTWADNPMCGYATVESSCEDGLTYTLTVPADGEETTFYFYPDYDDEIEIIRPVAPGETVEVNIPPVDDQPFVVYYYVETPKDRISGETPWTPCDEETPSPSPSETPSAQPQLPTTGSSMTIMIGSAAALIVAAAAIFLIMRRRRAAQDW